MRKKLLISGTLLVLLTSACAPQAQPTMNPADVQNTAAAAAFTVVAQTQAAIPTATPLPPTTTATPLPLPTTTPFPNSTGDPALATAATLLPTGAATTVPQQSSSNTGDDCNKALTSWSGPSARFTIDNQTNPRGEVVLSLYVVTRSGECGYLTDLSSGPVGSYSAGAFVNGRTNFKVFGGFEIQEGSWKIVVRNDKILAMASCHPNC